jgi:tetratricopeptide (TPR) repeat protein
MNWLEVLGWGKEQMEDLRFVGYSYLKQGKYDIALTFFEALAVLNPQSAYDLQTLGALYLELGRNLLALTYVERALKVDPTHLPTQLNRAKALFLLGYRKQATAQAKNLELSPEPTIASGASALLLAYA